MFHAGSDEGAICDDEGSSLADPLATDSGRFRPRGGDFDVLPTGEFTRVRKLASGIHGDVFQYHWLRRGPEGEHVAVKQLRSEALRRVAVLEHDEGATHRMFGGRVNRCTEDALAEIGVLQHLAAQPDLPLFILRLHGVFEYGCHTWLVTEFAEGGELFEAVSRQGEVSGAQAKRYAWGILQAIGYLHRHRIGHQDISLENVLLKDGDVRLMDFGMAVQTHAACGTPLRYFHLAGKDSYRAPECYVPQADLVDVMVPVGAVPGSIVFARACNVYLCEVRLPQDARPNCRARARVQGYEARPVDVFAAGVCVFTMLVGNPPWSKASPSDEHFSWVMEHDVVALQERWGVPSPPPELAAMLKGMTALDPARRWSVDECLSCPWFEELVGADVPVHPPRTTSLLCTLAGA